MRMRDSGRAAQTGRHRTGAVTLDINTITAVKRPCDRAGLWPFEAGDAWVGGGTWLFSRAAAEGEPPGRPPASAGSL